ncbi:MAG: hypothetical protein AB7N71_01665 [Phycisphaerae bacterium]
MSMEIMSDPRVRSVRWKDLRAVSIWETVRELTISLPWLAASLYFAQCAAFNTIWYFPALACSFLFFFAALR